MGLGHGLQYILFHCILFALVLPALRANMCRICEDPILQAKEMKTCLNVMLNTMPHQPFLTGYIYNFYTIEQGYSLVGRVFVNEYLYQI